MLDTPTIVQTNAKGAAVIRLTLTVRYGSKETRDSVLKSPMDQGVAAGYNRLEELLEGQPK